jgi:hypothetical protein
MVVNFCYCIIGLWFLPKHLQKNHIFDITSIPPYFHTFIYFHIFILTIAFSFITLTCHALKCLYAPCYYESTIILPKQFTIIKVPNWLVKLKSQTNLWNQSCKISLSTWGTKWHPKLDFKIQNSKSRSQSILLNYGNWLIILRLQIGFSSWHPIPCCHF